MKRKVLLIASACFVVSAVSLVAAKWWASGSTDRVAMSAVNDIVKGDVTNLYENAFVGESRYLTQRQAQQVYERILKPELAGLVVSGEPQINALDGSSTVVQVVQLDNGEPASVIVQAAETENGPRLLALHSMLITAWDFRARRAKDPSISKPGGIQTAWLNGLDRDRTFLEGIGLTGYVDSHGRFVSWDDSIARVTKNLKLIESSVAQKL